MTSFLQAQLTCFHADCQQECFKRLDARSPRHFLPYSNFLGSHTFFYHQTFLVNAKIQTDNVHINKNRKKKQNENVDMNDNN